MIDGANKSRNTKCWKKDECTAKMALVLASHGRQREDNEIDWTRNEMRAFPQCERAKDTADELAPASDVINVPSSKFEQRSRRFNDHGSN